MPWFFICCTVPNKLIFTSTLPQAAIWLKGCGFPSAGVKLHHILAGCCGAAVALQEETSSIAKSGWQGFHSNHQTLPGKGECPALIKPQWMQLSRETQHLFICSHFPQHAFTKTQQCMLDRALARMQGGFGLVYLPCPWASSPKTRTASSGCRVFQNTP